MASPSRPDGTNRTKTLGGERNSGGYTPTVVNLVISRLTFGYSLCCFFLPKTFQKFQVSDASTVTTISGSLSFRDLFFGRLASKGANFFSKKNRLVEPKCKQTGCKTWCRFFWRDKEGYINILYIYIYTYYIYILYIHIIFTYIYICR